ncbi:MAG: hypothetical protein IKJ67_01685 [Bacteroidales bacterium]|nr:hypothetical protein [Bacteroidales bacterium]
MKKTLRRLALLSFAMVLGFASCEDDLDPEHNGDNNGGGGATEELATVTTNNVTSITANSAICGGNVSSDGGSTITARGICWSTSQNPTTEDDATYSGTGIGSFTANITGLEAGTTYYVRAYAVNSKGTAYGTQKAFTTTTTGGGSSEELPTVTTSSVTSINTNSAICGGNVSSDGGSTVTARGVCWSTSQNPTTNDNTTTDGSGTGSFTSNISGLMAGITYYVRAYAVNSKGTAYGAQKTFTTTTTSGGGGETITGTINGHDYVDLGLPSGTKWATCNVGANIPEELGNYYSWGEITTQRHSTEDVNQMRSRYVYEISGNVNYDAATANWGGSWRMPTKGEMEELLNNCIFTHITQGIRGLRITGPNGNSIFLPAAGFVDGASGYHANNLGGCWYWSSTRDDTTYNPIAWQLYASSVHKIRGMLISYGCSVRPVSE